MARTVKLRRAVAGGVLMSAALWAIGLSPAAAQSGARYASTITFRWANAPPDGVLENDPLTGQRVVAPVHSPQSWETYQSPTAPLSRIYLRYAQDSYLLPYRSFRGAPPVTLLMGRPTFTCERSSVNEIERALGQDDPPSQIAAMMAAGNLLQLPLRACAQSSQRRLADLYYRLNCQLARSTHYIGYLNEAERYFRERWPGDAARAQFAQGCRDNAHAAFRYAVATQLNRLTQSGQHAEAVALAMDVQALNREPAWAATFNSYAALAEVDLKAWEISRLIEAQVAAQRAGQLAEAEAANAQLRMLANDPSLRPAFDRAQVSLDRISTDSQRIQAAIEWRNPVSSYANPAAAQPQRPDRDDR